MTLNIHLRKGTVKHLTHSLTGRKKEAALLSQGHRGRSTKGTTLYRAAGQNHQSFKENLFQEVILRGEFFILSV